MKLQPSGCSSSQGRRCCSRCSMYCVALMGPAGALTKTPFKLRSQHSLITRIGLEKLFVRIAKTEELRKLRISHIKVVLSGLAIKVAPPHAATDVISFAPAIKAFYGATAVELEQSWSCYLLHDLPMASTLVTSILVNVTVAR